MSAPANLVLEVAERAAALEDPQILAQIDHVETRVLEFRCDHGAVIDRVRQLRHVLIGRIAEHQRHALFGEGRLARQQQCCGEQATGAIGDIQAISS